MLKLTGRKAVRDDELGYPTWRAWHAWEAASELRAAFQPDVALVQSGQPMKMAAAFEVAGVPAAVYLRNVEEDDIGGDPRALKAARFIANSRFTADWYRQRFGIDSAVIHPLIQAESYRTETARTHVVFINPHPDKGLDVALAVAKACPDVSFLFIETWIMSAEERARLDAALAPLGNVTLVPRTRDMRTVYSKARIVLAPSRWAEAFGRIAAEAHVSGIPVIASDRGGLPEAVGEGGMLVSAEAPMQAWIDAVRRVWSDESAYADLSAKALAHAARPALDRAVQIAALVAELERTIAPTPARERAPA
jgi:glycosyltransferase involved in cell wall biosynthesis